MTFNPNDPGTADSNVFGLPYQVSDADLILLPVPWEATVSYGAGTAKGPDVILEASKQIDLFHPLVKKVWTNKVAMADVNKHIYKLSNKTRKKVEKVIDAITNGKKVNSETYKQINAASAEMNEFVFNAAKEFLKTGKTVCTIGGDHSTPLGLIKALSERHSFGVLQIDAHCDLRKSFEGFTYSHASVMYNILNEVKKVQSLTQVGIRDYCEEEINFIDRSNGRIKTFFDRDMQYAKYEGKTWKKICDEIVATLPEKVFVSFDIDGLTPDHCPHTGTPVPGGLQFQEVSYLLELVAKKRKIIAFDLNEVSPGKSEWDANVGARVLFQLCCAFWLSQKRK